MGSSSKWSLVKKTFVVVLLVAVLAVETARSQQSCSAGLNGLNVCGQFVVPGAPNSNPSAECCGALQAIPTDCLCNTLRVASSLPSRCNLPPLSCPN